MTIAKVEMEWSGIKQFEYKVASLMVSAHPDEIDVDREWLNDMGLIGYELVTIVDNIAYLKRETVAMRTVKGECTGWQKQK